MTKISKLVCVFLVSNFLFSCSSLPKTQDPQQTKENRVAEINIQLGMSYLESKDVERAKEKFLLALKQSPTLPEAWYSMAYFLEVTGDKDKANEYYLHAISLAPNRGDAQNNYGTFLCRIGNYKGAVQHFEMAVSDPSYLDMAGAYENAGLCALHIPNNHLAIKYFNHAVLQDPHRASSFFMLAELNYKAGKYELARQALKNYLAIAPLTPEVEHLKVALNQEKFFVKGQYGIK